LNLGAKRSTIATEIGENNHGRFLREESRGEDYASRSRWSEDKR